MSVFYPKGIKTPASGFGRRGLEKPAVHPQAVPDMLSCLSLGDAAGGKKGGKKKGSSFQTVSAVFRVRVSAVRLRVVFLPGEMARAKTNVLVLLCVPGELKQTDDQPEEHTPSLRTVSDSQ